MYREMEPVYFYITTMNENYQQPAMPAGNRQRVEAGIVKGMYLLEDGAAKDYKVSRPISPDLRLRLLGSGTILREVRQAAARLRAEYRVPVDVWSVTSYNELRREALAVTRHNMLNPGSKVEVPFVTAQLSQQQGPVISATDYMKSHADQIREFVPDSYRVLGTDGFGRSDSRQQLRHFFEVDSGFVLLAALHELKALGLVTDKQIRDLMEKSGIDKAKPSPLAQ